MPTENGNAEGVSALRARAARVTFKGKMKSKTVKAQVKSAVTRTVVERPLQEKGAVEIPDGLAKKYFLKSTFNTHDIMHSPVEKTIQMIDKILSGERLFTM